MADKYISKVVYNGKTLIDLTGDKVTKENLLSGVTAHGANGEPITGECTFDADTSSATAQSPDEILAGTKVWVRGSEWTGTMVNRGSVSGIMTGWTQDGEGNKVAPHYTIERGYHDGGGKVTLSQADLSELIASNIRKNHTILGVVGTMEGNENENLQERIVDAPLGGPNNTGEDLIVVCEEKDAEGKPYTGLSKVTIRKVPYVENPNGAGGITVTIGETQAS